MSLDPLSVPFLHSCERCRQKKRKCSGEKPACEWCRKHSIPCRYRRSMRFRRQLEAYPQSELNALAMPVQLAVTSAPGISSISTSSASASKSTSVPAIGDAGTSTATSASHPAAPLTSQQQQFTASNASGQLASAPAIAISSAISTPSASTAFAMPMQPIVSSNCDNRSGSSTNTSGSATNSIMTAAAAAAAAESRPPSFSANPSPNALSVDALSNLLSVDMVPLTNPIPPNLLQMVNSFLTPLSGMAPSYTPEWTASNNTEASILANLGDLAASRTLNAQPPTIPLSFNDNLTDPLNAGGLPQDFLSSEMMFSFGADPVIPDVSDLQMPMLQSSAAAVLNGTSNPRPFNLASFIAGTPSQSPPPLPTVSTNPALPSFPTSASRLSVDIASPRVESPMSIGPESHLQPKSIPKPRQQLLGNQMALPASYSQSIGTGVGFDPNPQSCLSLSQTAQSQSAPAPASNIPSSGADTHRDGAKDHSPTGHSVEVLEDDRVPPILEEYVSLIPGNPSASAIYKIMRETFKAPRMGMVSLNLELLWYMLHKSVLPRIVFYGHISSTIRCSAADLDIKSMVPPNIDESCYELALNEVPLIKDCSAIWGAIGLCMIARYEFQSARYKEMVAHADMALNVMYRIKFEGYSYPWHDIPADYKESFGFQYLLAIFWKCFLWKMIASMLIDQDMSINHRFDRLPDYSSKTYDLYTAGEKYDVDLMEMIPENSWFGANPDNPPKLRFSGPSDPEFMQLRPEGSPCFDRAATSGPYYQQLFAMFYKFLILQSKAKCGTIGLIQLLKGLWVFRERMRIWRYSLPQRIALNAEKVSEYLDTIKLESSASPRDIDLQASHLKDTTMLLLVYHMFLIRVNRFAMKMMLGEPLNLPPPDISTAAFGIRDLYDSAKSPKIVTDNLGMMNIYFHICRIQALESTNSLCNIVQAAYSCKFNFYTLGSPFIFSIYELLVTYVSFLRSHDKNIAWRSKSRLSNVFNILRMLRHWAPALHIFVAGIKALSDQSLCLEEPSDYNAFERDMIQPAMLAMTGSPISSADVSEDEDEAAPSKRRRTHRNQGQPLESTKDARANIRTSTAPIGARVPSDLKRDETLSYRAADPIPEFPNPYPPNHIISLIIKDLGLSLAEFLAPSYPILLLKLMPSASFHAAPTGFLKAFGQSSQPS